jgi:hypothetical protein
MSGPTWWLEMNASLLDVRVDTSEHAGEQVVAQQQRLGGHRRSVVVAPVQGDHLVGHRGQELVAGEREGGGRHCGLLSRPPSCLRA